MTSICEQHRACMHQADCPDHHCPGREMGREALLLKLQQEIADDAAVMHIELFARRVPSNAPIAVWNVNEPDEDELDGRRTMEQAKKDLARAVRYLDLRGLLVRPVTGSPELVSFGRA